MKKLIAFGDSWTHGHGVETDISYKEIARADDFTFNLRMCNSWPRWLADKLELPYCNFGYPGIDNIEISKTIDMFQKKLSKDDLILVMLSFPYRHLGRGGVEARFTLKMILEGIQRKLNGYNYYLLNSFCNTFYDEPELKSQLDLSRFICIDTTASDILTQYEKEHDVSVWEYGCRKVYEDVKNFQGGDYHPNLLGYKVIADWIYKELPQK